MTTADLNHRIRAVDERLIAGEISSAQWGAEMRQLQRSHANDMTNAHESSQEDPLLPSCDG